MRFEIGGYFSRLKFLLIYLLNQTVQNDCIILDNGSTVFCLSLRTVFSMA